MTSKPVARRLTLDDQPGIMRLYSHLITNEAFPTGDAATGLLAAILDHPGTSLFGAEAGGQLRAMCTIHILPNITRTARPYALIENVVSDAGHRGQGFARAAMQAAIAAAWDADCYKVMLLSGSSDGHGFYPKLGFDGDAKRGFILRAP
ncbi:GNAT family N-acetyltransferase [Yoonia sp. R2331]|uniref:GNAT family N-acetyltransferase n=1 Tax=Yoonia sp. R2331 TaxID=3237238 RepID=UPI0034E4D410